MDLRDTPALPRRLTRARAGQAATVLAAALALALPACSRSGSSKSPSPSPVAASDAGAGASARVPPGDIAAGIDLTSTQPDPLLVRYLQDSAFRRAELEASLVNPDNLYSQDRLDHYETHKAGDWGEIAEFNPRVAPIRSGDLDAPGGARIASGLPAEAAALTITPEMRAGIPAALVELGRQAFFRYPAQLVWHFEPGLRSRATAAQYGFWVDPERDEVGGVIRTRSTEGTDAFAYTCATCHAWPVDGKLVIGLGNPRLDLGALTGQWMRENGQQPPAELAAWGPGRADVSTPEGRDPIRLPDLRSVRYLYHLHHNGTLSQFSVITLAIRLETLLVTGFGKGLRPPREAALGLALYLLTLRTEPGPTTEASTRGAQLFTTRCANCHRPPAGAGPAVSLDSVGTDAHIGHSAWRGTGKWRVPTLLGVALRQTLLHDGSLTSVEALMDPARTQPGYTGGVRPGPVPGHRFGLDLGPGERGDLVAYLRSL